MKLVPLSIVALLFAAPFANAQSNDDSLCNSPFVVFGPVASVCEATGAEMPDTDMVGIIGGSKVPGRKTLTDVLIGTLTEDNLEAARVVDALGLGGRDRSMPSISLPASAMVHPSSEPIHPCDADPSSFECEYQRIVDDVNAQFDSNY